MIWNSNFMSKLEIHISRLCLNTFNEFHCIIYTIFPLLISFCGNFQLSKRVKIIFQVLGFFLFKEEKQSLYPQSLIISIYSPHKQIKYQVNKKLLFNFPIIKNLTFQHFKIYASGMFLKPRLVNSWVFVVCPKTHK